MWLCGVEGMVLCGWVVLVVIDGSGGDVGGG